MYLEIKYALLVLVAIAFVADGRTIRARRLTTSDHRLAELEALKGLSQIKGVAKQIYVGYGLRDPKKLGRRRRTLPFLKFADIFNRIRLREVEDNEIPKW